MGEYSDIGAHPDIVVPGPALVGSDGRRRCGTLHHHQATKLPQACGPPKKTSHRHKLGVTNFAHSAMNNTNTTATTNTTLILPLMLILIISATTTTDTNTTTNTTTDTRMSCGTIPSTNMPAISRTLLPNLLETCRRLWLAKWTSQTLNSILRVAQQQVVYSCLTGGEHPRQAPEASENKTTQKAAM
jgi:hypothetical protein